MDDPDDPILSGPHGEPQWHSGIIGAITHTHGYASAAVAFTRDAIGIGLDAETWMPDHCAAEVWHPIATRTEIDAIVRTTGLPFPRALTLIFSAKETIFKCLFPQ